MESGATSALRPSLRPIEMADPMTAPDWTMLTSFLSEMDALDATAQAVVENADHEDKAPSAAASGPQAKSDAKEKKKRQRISSTERKKREKLELLTSIDQLQSQLEQISTQMQDERQRMEIKDELNHENFRLRWTMRREKTRANRLSRLLKRLWIPTKSMMADIVKHSRLVHSSEQEARIRDLERQINNRFRHIAKRWSQNTLPVVAGEAFDTVPSPDGLSMEHRLVRVLPFDVDAITDAVWRCGQIDMREFYRINRDTLAVTEELAVCPPGHPEVTLQLHVVFGRFEYRNRSMFMWESECDWLGPLGEKCSATIESGWSLIESLGVGAASPVSAVQIFSPVVSIEPDDLWLNLLFKSRAISRPELSSHQKLIVERFQRIENRLVDEASQSRSPTEISM